MSKGGITINGKHSYRDLGMRLLSRTIGLPTKRTAFVDDVPFMDGRYDLATTAHRTYWGPRTATYVFRALHDGNAERAHECAFWLAFVSDDEIYDDFEEGWYLVGSLAEMTISEHPSRHYTDITATFNCDPYWTEIEPIVEGYLTDSVYEFEILYDGMPTTVIATAEPDSDNPPEDDEVYVEFGGTLQQIIGETQLVEELPTGSSYLKVLTANYRITLTYHTKRL